MVTRVGTTSTQGPNRARDEMRRQGVGGYPKKWKIGATSFMDGPLAILPFAIGTEGASFCKYANKYSSKKFLIENVQGRS